MLSKEKGSKEKGEDHAVGTDGKGKRIAKFGDDQIAQAFCAKILQKMLILVIHIALDVHVSIPLTMLKELENDNYSVLMLMILVMPP